MENIQERIQKLTASVHDMDSKRNYREVDDHQFDAMYKKLVKLEKQYPEFADPNSYTQRQGSNTINRFRKFRHHYPILSFRRGNIPNILMLLDEEKEIIAQENINGVYISLSYSDGKLINAVTKGDGYEGKDVTQNARTIKNIPFFIPIKEHVEIHGVINYPTSYFNKLKKSDKIYHSSTDAASQIMLSKKSKLVAKHHLSFRANYLIENNCFGISYTKMIQQLREMNFEIPNIEICKTPDVIKKITSANQSKDIPANGIIFRQNITITDEDRLKFRRFEPKAYIWYKPKTIQKRIMGVDWSKHKNGNIIPSLVFEIPLKLNGSSYQKLSLKNVENLKQLNLHYNDTAEISISTGKPELSRIMEELRVEHPFPINAPNHCHYCGAELVTKGKQIICNNSSGCSPHTYSSIKNSYRHENEFDCYGDWKFMHLKIVANFFGARAIKRRDEDGKLINILQFDFCNQLADISFTLNAEKMPIKIYTSDYNRKFEVDDKTKSLGRQCSRYFFYTSRYSSTFEEVKQIFRTLSYLKLMGIDDYMSFRYNDYTKYSDIRFFFSWIGGSKNEALRIITKDPNLKPEPPVKKSFWESLFSPGPVVKF